MPHIAALLGCAVLLALSLWIVGRARADEPFIARVLHPSGRSRQEPREEDDVRWRWGGR